MAAKKPGASKTARRSMPAAAAGGALQLGGARLIIPCNSGKNAYVRSAKTGAMPNVAVSSPRFTDLVAETAAAGFAGQLRSELVALDAAHPGHGWDAALAELETAGALPA